MLYHATLADVTQRSKKGATVRRCEVVHEKSDRVMPYCETRETGCNTIETKNLEKMILAHYIK